MSEIQWLVDIMLNCKLSAAVKERFIARIGEVEAQLMKPTIRISPGNPIGVPIQAPSMQRIMDEMTHEAPTTPPPARVIVPKEVVTSSGNGTSTRGPRKF